MKTNRDIGIYCHLPFCQRKCAYCDFYSGCFYDLADAYIDAILKEADRYAMEYPKLSVSTLYLGGGTPSSLTEKQLERLLNGLFDRFDLTEVLEVTVEANPATLDEKKLIALKKAGVTRISIGVQSTDDRELETLSRLHSFEEFLETYRLVTRYFDNVSLDLMFGLPDQTVESFELTLRRITALSPAHISLYALKIEEGTRFGQMRDSLALPDDDAVATMYLLANRILTEFGYEQYEISNYARQGCLSKHNLRYWEGKEYIGLGPAAHSYFDGVRYANKADIHAYVNALHSGDIPKRSEEYRMMRDDLLEEAIILPLRLVKGLDTSRLFDTYGYDILSESADLIALYIKEGYMKLDGTVLSFTPKGFLVSNTILSELIP